MPMSDAPKIPLCRSEFLQDFAIDLGRHLRATDHGWRSFQTVVDICEHEGKSLERLNIWVTTYDFTQVCLSLYENKIIWVSVAVLPRKPDNFEVSFQPDFALIGMERLVEALIETVSISTRLCYDESPEPLLRQIWKFSGEVNIEGAI